MANGSLKNFAVAIMLASACAPLIYAQDKKCEESLTAQDGYTVRAWKVNTRWGDASLPPPLTKDPAYSPDKVSSAVEEVRTALRPQLDFDLASHGGFSVLYVGSCVQKVGPKQVDVIISPFLIRVDLVKIGSNILPIPRFNRPAAPASLPGPLARLNPALGLESDRRTGVGERLAFSTDVLTLFGPADAVPGPTKLVVDGDGSKAFNRDFYDGRVRLAFSRARPASTLRGISLFSSFEGEHQPLQSSDYLRNAVRAGAQFLISPQSTPFRKVLLAANYRWSGNRLLPATSGPSQRENESGYEVQAVADMRLLGGIARLAGWFDGGSPTSGSYERGVAIAGYGRDIPVAPNQTFGVEALFGAGKVWGIAPQYALFFGGNQGANFLYEEITSVSLAGVPVGPVLRSYGEAQAGAGANSFWNLSLNMSVPIPKLSRPLIPSVDTPIGPLNNVLKRQAVNSAKSFLTAFYKNEGAAAEEAEDQADADLREIRPAVNYLADYANIYAIKPLFLFDVARLGSQTRQAIGGGIQFTLVVARFEAGYMRTINPLPGENRGNFVLRLSFQNLF
jgi:hypothetical protein